jgi:hypothetical protein
MTLDELKDAYRAMHGRELTAEDLQSLGGENGGWRNMSKAQFEEEVIKPSEEYIWAPTKKLISDWYGMKPATPTTFSFTPEAETAAKLSVGQEYRPFYQEQATQSGEDFKTALANARQGFSRRGLWGAAAGTQTTIDPATGLATTNIGAGAPTGGPVSGLRQAGEEQLGRVQGERGTAFGRAYTEAVAGGVQGRQTEAQDVWQKTIQDPYDQAYQQWLTQLNLLQSQQPKR